MKKFIILSLLLLISCAQPQTQLPDYSTTITEKERDIQNQMFADSWLDTYLPFSTMGTDILFSASDLCAEDDRIFALGMNLANEYSAYETIRKEINKSLSLGSKLKVVSLGTNSPASKAGILVGDEILEIDGESLIQGEDAFKSYVEKIDKDYQKLYEFKILRGDEFKNIKIRSEQRCRFNFVIDLDNNTFNAFANGEIMVFSLRMAKWLIQNETGAAIVFAHELGHRKTKWERFLAKLLLMPSLYMHFYIEHNFGHHLNVGTPDDPATSKKNQSVFSFWFTSTIGQIRNAIRIQKNLLKNKKVGFFSVYNDFFYYQIFQIIF